MFKKLLTIAALLAAHSVAEDDHFDMALHGGFLQDACTISFVHENSFDVDASNPNTTPASNAGPEKMSASNNDQRSLIGFKLTKVQCTAGTYNFSLRTTDTEYVDDIAANQRFSAHGGLSYNYDSNTPTLISSTNPVSLNVVTLSNDDFISIENSIYAEPIDGNWLNSADTFSKQFSFSLTIEATEPY